MKSLIIAEKPSVAADLARALGKVPKQKDHYENDRYVISSAVGHVVELRMPEDIDKKKYGFWRLDALPIIPETFELKPIESSKDRFNQLKKLLARKDIDEVINACDAGREGELIFNYLYQLTKCRLPVQRAWIQTMTPQGIRTAFERLRSAEEMAGLGDAARCRSESDWLIGINGTRAITKRMFGSRAGNVASVGRVQTPTLALIVGREHDIRSFQPRDYWRVTATFQVAAGQYEGTYQRPDFRKNDDEHDRADRLWDLAAAEAVLAACQGQPLARVSEEKKAATQAAPRLYDLTTLQREANSRLGLSARRTLQVAQALYERHKVISYPRTDSRALPEDYIPTCRDALTQLSGELAPHAARVLDSGWVRPNKRIFNNAQISDHFAIIPTTQSAAKLDGIEAKVFDMIARRFVAVFHPAAEFAITTRTSEVGPHRFKTEGKVLTSPGWLAVYGRTSIDEDESAAGGAASNSSADGTAEAATDGSSPAKPTGKNKSLPALSPEDSAPASTSPPAQAQARTLAAELHAEATKPPPRYTEATLLTAMETAGKLLDAEELAEAMKERGLGTPATRADTIDGLINQRYLEREGRELAPTPKAEQLLEFLTAIKAEALTSPAMTGEWEFKLRQMEQRHFARADFMAEIVEQTKALVENVKTFEEDAASGRETAILSPTDGLPLRETLRAYKSQDGALSIYKVIGGRKMSEDEIAALVRERQIGPLDGFVSAKTRARFAASLKLVHDAEADKWKTELDFGDKVDLGSLTPLWRDEKTGAELCEAGPHFVLREKRGEDWEQTFRVGRLMCQKPIGPEHAIQLVSQGKTELIQGFISKRGRPFDAFLTRDGARIRWEFPPRAPRVGKDGKPVARKTKAPPDLSQASVLGPSKLHRGGELVQTADAYYVRKPEEDGRIVFELKRQLCQQEIPPAEVQKLVTDGKSGLIEGFVSKRGTQFSAYLVLSPKKNKADFEFPPR
ncbi:DNA topoisomerase III [Cephaloticoccus primus]|uniref:DNA topoisomerase n=1 Tax=Cephaloticoccus primus TaxID=1548207 RepID=A0A139SKQ6_9BACT|nr:type IA DNA topoisomerase [Cephaloticoccus primus]KXU35133.1 DNA topoisomerase III [Cephaloticoccus primus]